MEARQQPDNSFGGHFASWIVCIPPNFEHTVENSERPSKAELRRSPFPSVRALTVGSYSYPVRGSCPR